MKINILDRLTNKYLHNNLLLATCLLLALSIPSLSYAQEKPEVDKLPETQAQPKKEESDEDKLAKMQALLNQEVMSKPFLAEKPEEVNAYIKGMLENNVKPPEYSGTHWRQGYTCRDLLRYNWTQYRNCRYYYRYHGRYY